MRTLTIEEASSFLRIPACEILARIETDNLPAAKLGNELLFIDSDLADYLRGHYQTMVVNIQPLLDVATNKSH